MRVLQIVRCHGALIVLVYTVSFVACSALNMFSESFCRPSLLVLALQTGAESHSPLYPVRDENLAYVICLQMCTHFYRCAFRIAFRLRYSGADVFPYDASFARLAVLCTPSDPARHYRQQVFHRGPKHWERRRIKKTSGHTNVLAGCSKKQNEEKDLEPRVLTLFGGMAFHLDRRERRDNLPSNTIKTSGKVSKRPEFRQSLSVFHLGRALNWLRMDTLRRQNRSICKGWIPVATCSCRTAFFVRLHLLYTPDFSTNTEIVMKYFSPFILPLALRCVLSQNYLPWNHYVRADATEWTVSHCRPKIVGVATPLP